MNRISFYLLIILTVASCTRTEQHHTPRPKAYPRVERSDSILQHEFVDFQFQYSSDAFLEETPSDNKGQVWFNLEYPIFNATVYCTYAIIDTSELKSYLMDAKMFVRKNADGNVDVKEFDYVNPDLKYRGSLYYFEGNTRSPYQFYLTDRETYFLRGSLYYNVEVITDSIQPITKSLEKDLMQMIETFEKK